jgi:uncharacterized protein
MTDQQNNMSENQPPLDLGLTPPPRRQPKPWAVALVVLVGALGGFTLIGPFIGLAVAFPFYSGDLLNYLSDIGDPVGKPFMKTPMMIVQGVATFVGLAVIPTMMWSSMTNRKVTELIKENKPNIILFLMAAGIVVFFMGPNSVVIELNSKMNLPDGGFESWARDFEERAGELTKYLTSFSTLGQYLGGVLVIAILPALGEELVFRGYLQPAFQRATKNPHVAIWLSAILFSALHLQFYGFIPRVLLGAVFGYLYLWSGNLLIPMFAHFVNNFLAVTMIYSGLSDLPGMELEEPTAMPWYLVVITTAVFVSLTYMFYKSRRPVTIN